MNESVLRPVDALFGKGGGDGMPLMATPAGGTIAFHMRAGTPGQNDDDWEQFMDFVGRQFGAPAR